MVKRASSKVDTSNWYEVWMNQSKEFFDSTEEQLKIFNEKIYKNPEENLNQINQWLESLKERWQKAQYEEDSEKFQNYWNMMSKMYNESAELMLKQWIKRTHEAKAINDVNDLYELWLRSCHEVYQKTLLTRAYQETYSDMMNAAIKFWHAALTK